MGFEKYTEGQARKIAERIHTHYGPIIEQVCRAYPNVRPETLAGLTGMENPNCYEWPDGHSMRFEAGVYAKLRAIRSVVKFWRRSYNGVTQAMLKGLDDAALRALSLSYGQTQIMGYYMLTLFANKALYVICNFPKQNPEGISDVTEVAKLMHLRLARVHYYFTAYMLTHDPQLAHYNGLDKGGNRYQVLGQVAHIWNSGRPWDGTPKGIKTYSPYYMYNVTEVAQQYASFIEAQ